MQDKGRLLPPDRSLILMLSWLEFWLVLWNTTRWVEIAHSHPDRSLILGDRDGWSKIGEKLGEKFNHYWLEYGSSRGKLTWVISPCEHWTQGFCKRCGDYVGLPSSLVCNAHPQCTHHCCVCPWAGWASGWQDHHHQEQAWCQPWLHGFEDHKDL